MQMFLENLDKFNIIHRQLIQSLPYWFCIFSTAILSVCNINFIIQTLRVGIESTLQPYGSSIQLWWFCAIMIFIGAILPAMGILFLVQKYCPTVSTWLLPYITSSIAKKISVMLIAINLLSIFATLVLGIMMFCKGYIK